MTVSFLSNRVKKISRYLIFKQEFALHKPFDWTLLIEYFYQQIHVYLNKIWNVLREALLMLHRKPTYTKFFFNLTNL